MGYYSNHKLMIYTLDGKECKLSDIEFHECNISTTIYPKDTEFNVFEDREKWYNMEEDMKKYSKTFSTFIFEIHRKGEEDGDEYKHYYYNGKSDNIRAKVSFKKSKFFKYK